MKDIVRGKNAADHWPQSLKARKIGGRQRVGDGRAFEFVPYSSGQLDPFESSFKRSEDLPRVLIQSLSIPLAARSLGRKDESWLIQVAVSLRVIETHFATRPRTPPLPILEIAHLQTGVKLATAEVDALFLATIELEGKKRIQALVTCEAKQSNERILDHQIVEQIVAANRSLKAAGIRVDLIIPIAMQADRDGCIYVAEFEPWDSAVAELDEARLPGLVLASEGLYKLAPTVTGIGSKKIKAANVAIDTETIEI